jgi:hypothetical protein
MGMLLELLKFDIYGEVNLNYLQVEHSTTWVNDFMSFIVVAKYLSKGVENPLPFHKKVIKYTIVLDMIMCHG